MQRIIRNPYIWFLRIKRHQCYGNSVFWHLLVTEKIIPRQGADQRIHGPGKKITLHPVQIKAVHTSMQCRTAHFEQVVHIIIIRFKLHLVLYRPQWRIKTKGGNLSPLVAFQWNISESAFRQSDGASFFWQGNRSQWILFQFLIIPFQCFFGSFANAYGYSSLSFRLKGQCSNLKMEKVDEDITILSDTNSVFTLHLSIAHGEYLWRFNPGCHILRSIRQHARFIIHYGTLGYCPMLFIHADLPFIRIFQSRPFQNDTR